MTWEQCESLILAVVLMAVIVVPQFLFSLVQVPEGFEEEQKKKAAKRLAKIQGHIHAHSHSHDHPTDPDKGKAE